MGNSNLRPFNSKDDPDDFDEQTILKNRMSKTKNTKKLFDNSSDEDQKPKMEEKNPVAKYR